MAHDHDGWRSLGFRGLPPMSGRVNQPVEGGFAPLILPRVDGMHTPFVGITTDGVRADRSALARRARRRSPLRRSLTPRSRSCSRSLRRSESQACLPMDAPQWREWTNVHVAFWRHGVMLDHAVASAARPRARHPARHAVGTGLRLRHRDHGAQRARCQLKDDHDSYGQWLYFVSIYGTPGGDEPWGWQIDGHHLVISTVVFDGRIVHDADVHGLGASIDRRPVVVRPRGGSRAAA